MKPKLEQLSPHKSKQSFNCYEVNVPAFEFLWHYHPEYELTYIIKGKGKRLVGDSYKSFEVGDLVLLGPMLPHTWITEKKIKENCRAIVIQFSQDFVQQLFQFPEMKAFEKLFIKAGRGLHYYFSKQNNFIPLLEKMLQNSELTSFILFIELLQELAIKKATPLTSLQYKPIKGNENLKRINKVFQYVEREFKDKISLQKAASLIHLSESAFCKFFKRASGKTFSEYTNEKRIANACQLLMESDMPISQIAHNSGYESLTYFNRVFLKKKGITPLAFKKLAL